MTTPHVDIEGSWTVHSLPRVLWHCQLNNLDWSKCGGAVIPVLDFMSAAVEGEATRLLLIGEPGLGKSHIGAGLFRWGVLQWDTLNCIFVHVPTFCDEVKQKYSLDLDPYADLREAKRLIILDDVFGRELTEHELTQIVPRIIEIAYANGAAVVVTMNQTITQARKRLAPHEFDRLISGARFLVEFAGVSARIYSDPDQLILPTS